MNRNRIIIALLAITLAAGRAGSQSLDDLNIQIHGYATQGFLYSNVNNFFTTTSSNGSPAWDEAVVNISSQPIPKLRIGVQGRYSLLGNLGNAITLDWAAADYKVNNKFGVRFGKVKTPLGQFNEIQDIDPGYQWALLPQSVYPLESRNFQLAHYGGVAYGTIDGGHSVGKFDYRGFAGERVISGQDGYLLSLTEAGIGFPNGVSATAFGGNLKWRPPLAGLELGASDAKTDAANSNVTDGAYSGTFTTEPFNGVQEYGRYEKGRFMVAGEYKRAQTIFTVTIALPTGPHAIVQHLDQRSWYGMAAYKVTEKLSAGLYDSQIIDHQQPLGPARYSKDWVVNLHYDFNQYLYVKAEQHFIEGDNQNIDHALNLGGIHPSSRLTVFKLGVSF
jgi:hypothetical protein